VTADLAIVVLAGGEGRRMGGEKARRPWGPTTLVGHAVGLARAYGGEVAVAVRDAAQVAGAVEARLLLDDPGIEGPLAGLAAARGFARATGAPRLLTLPCDAPLLPADLAARLQAALAPGVGVAVAQSDGREHPTCALWRAGALGVLPAYLATGRRSLNGFAAAAGMTTVDWPVDGGDPFANANTLEDLQALRLALPRGVKPNAEAPRSPRAPDGCPVLA
jgi:molybdopterin-guanine dinucleotide biosynthesis protein A